MSMTVEEQKRNLMKAVGNAMAELLEEVMPAASKFTPFYVQFPVIDTKNDSRMQITWNAPGEVRIQLGVFRKGTDRQYSNYLLRASAEEMMRYVRDPDSHEVWMEQIEHLSEKVDEYWG